MNLLAQHIIKKTLLISILWVAALPVISQASFVRIETSLGDINIELFDDAAPNTVANFMNYVNDGDFVNSFFHRSIPGFILQGGGFIFDGSDYYYVPEDAPVGNEYNLSNLRGTLAMAKIPSVDFYGNPIPGGGPDSATNQWFINLADNSENLNSQNGGFTVFGQVIDGMDIVDTISLLPTIALGSVIGSNVPVNGYSGDPATYDPANQLVMVNSISAVPVPAAAWLFGSGLMGLIAVARRADQKKAGI